MEQIYLSRRNLLVLLSKLDRVAAGGASACTIIKQQNLDDPFVQSMDTIQVTVVEDVDYYAARSAGPMHPSDEVAVATKLYSEAMAFKPDVHTSDAPPPLVTIHLNSISEKTGWPFKPVFIGHGNGKEAREYFKLDELDVSGSKVKIIVDPNTYSISSSFFHGFLDASVLRAGSRDKFFEKYEFQMDRMQFNVLEKSIEVAFNVAEAINK